MLPLPSPSPSLTTDLRLLTQPADQRLLQTDPEAIIVLSCVAEGIPLPTVSLLKGENQIILDGVVAMETVNKTLVISSPTVGDSGHYTCVAENAFGKVESQSAVVDVTGEWGGGGVEVGGGRGGGRLVVVITAASSL